MDAVRIQIIRGCNAQGQGGTIADDASAVLADGVLDQTAAAFQAQYGLYTYANTAFDAEQTESEANSRNITVSPLRNISTRLRLFAEEATLAYAGSQIDAAANQQKAAIAEAILGGRSIVENQ